MILIRPTVLSAFIGLAVMLTSSAVDASDVALNEEEDVSGQQSASQAVLAANELMGIVQLPNVQSITYEFPNAALRVADKQLQPTKLKKGRKTILIVVGIVAVLVVILLAHGPSIT